MGRTSDKDRVGVWQSRVTASGKIYKKWEEKYRCDLLEQYYHGHQWAEQPEEMAEEHYTINMVFPSVEIKIPSLFFYHPNVKIRPRPAKADDTGTLSEERAKLQQDTVNTFIQDPRLDFKGEVSLALRESFYRFGVIEVGYTADFIDNPLLQKPELELTEKEKELAKAKKIPNPENENPESLYIKRIPARNFRAGVNAKNSIHRCDWVGYFEEHYPSDLKKNENYKNTSGLKATGRIKKDITGEGAEEKDRDVDGNVVDRDTVRVWKIWDLRSRKRIVFVDGGEKFLLEDTFTYLPFAVLKQYEILDQFLPFPPVYNWLHPQNELNETREMQRVHRKRFYRRYTYRDGAIDPAEIEKLESGGDGVYARANQPDPIQAVPDAPLDPSIARNIPDSKQDFMEISGVSEEQRGNAVDTTTATQANIVDVRSRIRENYQRENVAGWMANIARLILKTIKENMVLPIWVQMNIDPTGQQPAQEAAKVGALWKMITSTELGPIEEDITVDMTSLTPLVEQEEMRNWTQVLGLLTNPALVAVLMASDVLLRKTLGYFNVKSEKEIAEVKKAGMAILAQLAAAAAAQAGAKGAGGQQGSPGPGPTPDNDLIAQQLQSQMGVQ